MYLEEIEKNIIFTQKVIDSTAQNTAVCEKKEVIGLRILAIETKEFLQAKKDEILDPPTTFKIHSYNFNQKLGRVVWDVIFKKKLY